MTILPENIEIAGVTVSYNNNPGAVDEPVTSWSWSYPNLVVEMVYVNAVADYMISFADEVGNQLFISDVEVLGGLCVIENVDQTDPVGLRRIPFNPNGND